METRHAGSGCRTSCDARAPVDRPCDAEAKTRVAYDSYPAEWSCRPARTGMASDCLMCCEQPQ